MSTGFRNSYREACTIGYPIARSKARHRRVRAVYRETIFKSTSEPGTRLGDLGIAHTRALIARVAFDCVPENPSIKGSITHACCAAADIEFPCRLACENSASAAAVTASWKGAIDGSATGTGVTARAGITVGCSICAGVIGRCSLVNRSFIDERTAEY